MRRPDFNVPSMAHSSEQQPGDLSSLTPWRASFREAGAWLCVLHLAQPFTRGAVTQVPLPFPGADEQADIRDTVWCVLSALREHRGVPSKVWGPGWRMDPARLFHRGDNLI